MASLPISERCSVELIGPQFVSSATKGLIAFRDEDPDHGRMWYQRANGEAPNAESRRLVLLHCAREELSIDRVRARALLDRTEVEPQARREQDP
jgi:hypothetical protein